MRITQGCFSFLSDLADDQIRAQVQYCIDRGWAVNIEFTDDPHPAAYAYLLCRGISWACAGHTPRPQTEPHLQKPFQRSREKRFNTD
jgi:ribulose bisphosphate carboxylase small subunit